MKDVIRSESGNKSETYRKLCFLNEGEIDTEELKTFLEEELASGGLQSKGKSELKRLIRIYDFLKHKSIRDTFTTSANA